MRTRLALVAALALAGCTLPDPGAPPADDAPPAGTRATVVRAVDDAFEPPRVSVAAGGVVTWRNEGARPHSVTLPALGLDVVLEPGASTNATFAEPGTYAYRCKFHRGMAGNVTVGGVSTPALPPATNGTAPDANAPPPASGIVRDVTVVDDAFQPAAASVPVGGAVRWTNRGGGHSVTFSALPIDRVLDSGDAFQATFEQAGTFAYVCRFHDEMRGTITVTTGDATGGDAPPPAADPAAHIVLDGGHYDERPVEVPAGTSVTWSNPTDEAITVEFRDRADALVVPPGGTASLALPVGEHWWRDARDAGEWRADDHDVGVVRVRAG